MKVLKTDKTGYDDLYKDSVSELVSLPSREEYR